VGQLLLPMTAGITRSKQPRFFTMGSPSGVRRSPRPTSAYRALNGSRWPRTTATITATSSPSCRGAYANVKVPGRIRLGDPVMPAD